MFYQREIMYKTELSLQTVQRELENLIRLGILEKRETKARVYYQINMSSPWFRPLKEICRLVWENANFLTEFFSQVCETGFIPKKVGLFELRNVAQWSLLHTARAGIAE
jgi:hypothetical protein